MRHIAQAVLAIAIPLALASAARADNAKPADPVVAKVNGMEIHRSAVEESAKSLPAQYQSQIAQIMPALIDREIDLTLVSIAADKSNIASDADVQKEIEKAKT